LELDGEWRFQKLGEVPSPLAAHAPVNLLTFFQLLQSSLLICSLWPRQFSWPSVRRQSF